jgi:hypothetical protein
VSLSDVARDVGKNLSVVSRVNGAQRRSRVIERAIAQRLGLSLREAFPEWYTGGGASGHGSAEASRGGEPLTPDE